ncbi:glycosyltransferase family 2 protein [Cerasicoccus frondis]|uniref:glycosyltransferase family 2 protein n=1 Tax=Cerasicoccus frondis TaxID=490090 RepID=UPI00285252ED|nr:glycosyltransferase [Cerasicoccus frondis]
MFVISAVVPTRNRIGLLADAIASLVGVERIVVVDDASEEANVVSDLADSHRNVTLFRNDIAKGAAACRNIGVGLSDGEWILFLDDDDILLDGYLKEMAGVIRAHPEVEAWAPSYREGRQHTRRRVRDCDVNFVNAVSGCSGFLIKRKLFDDIGGFDEALVSMQDWDLWMRIVGRSQFWYSGIVGVSYALASPGKITHNLWSKYRGLRRLYIKHKLRFGSFACIWHLHRLYALRIILNLSRFSSRRTFFSPLVAFYWLRWRRYAV